MILQYIPSILSDIRSHMNRALKIESYTICVRLMDFVLGFLDSGKGDDALLIYILSIVPNATSITKSYGRGRIAYGMLPINSWNILEFIEVTTNVSNEGTNVALLVHAKILNHPMVLVHAKILHHPMVLPSLFLLKTNIIVSHGWIRLEINTSTILTF